MKNFGQQAFSNDPIWDLQKAYYQELSIAQSWGQDDIPFYATSNPFIADFYCDFISHKIEQKLQTQGLDSTSPIDILIFEIGVGHGRFSYLLLKALDQRLGLIAGKYKQLKFKYILSDVSLSNCEAWKNHPKFQPYIKANLVDFALFDVTHLLANKAPQASQLLLSHGNLEDDLQGKSAFIISNFMLCALPYDLFRLQDKALYACLLKSSYVDGFEAQGETIKQQIANTQFEFEYQDIDSNFYSDPSFNKILKAYQEQFKNTTFTFPLHLMALANYFECQFKEYFWLISDEALVLDKQIENSKAIVGRIANGTFSNRINLNALALYLQDYGTIISHCKVPDKRTDSYIICSKQAQLNHQISIDELSHHLEGFSPKAYFRLMRSYLNSAKQLSQLSLDSFIALLQMSHFDPQLIKYIHPQLLKLAPNADNYRRDTLVDALEKIWDNYYDLGEQFFMAYILGRIMRHLKQFDRAIDLLIHATERDNKHYRSWYILAKCYQTIGQIDKAKACYKVVLKLKPEHAYAQQRLMQLQDT